ncbi:YebC/PmpR family DNA-binding transcriptional regulator [Patescibacteria group bacterium]
MSGHSHYATIKRTKEAKDAAKGKVFSRLAKEISIAVKAGGGNKDPDSNYKLRIIMEKAKAANMPKSNIERALSKGSEGAAMEAVSYEGYGPKGISVIVETATDNRNRTAQEIKSMFERVGGSLGGPGSVSFNFESKGLLVVKKRQDVQNQMLTLIDEGVEDVEETTDAVEAYVAPGKLKEMKDKLESKGFEVTSMELYMKPKNMQAVTEGKDATKILEFLDTLDEHEDVQNVFTNVDIPDDLVA